LININKFEKYLNIFILTLTLNMSEEVVRDWTLSDNVFYNWSKQAIIHHLNRSGLFDNVVDYKQGSNDEDITYCLDSWVEGSNGRIGMQNRVQFVENKKSGVYNPTIRYDRPGSGRQTEIFKFKKNYPKRIGIPYPRFLTWILYNKTNKEIIELKIVDIEKFIRKWTNNLENNNEYRLAHDYTIKDVDDGAQRLLVVKDEDIAYAYP